MRPVKPPTQKDVEESGREMWSEAVFFAQVDLKGWLPIWLVNMMAGEVGGSIYNLRSYFERKRIKDEKEKKKKDKEKTKGKDKLKEKEKEKEKENDLKPD